MNNDQLIRSIKKPSKHLNSNDPYQQFLLVSLTQIKELIKNKNTIQIEAAAEILPILNEIETKMLEILSKK